MERVCEDGAQYQSTSNQAKLFMARLHTTDLTLIQQLVAAFITQDSRIACVSVTVY